MPQVGPTIGLNATGTPCVSSNTVSIAPAAPHRIWKSAARTTLASAPSQIRPGEFGTVLYDWMFAIVTPAIPPAVCAMFGTLKVLAHAPVDGAHVPPFGFTVFSWFPPVHHRGPLKDELAGSPFASPRPYDVRRHVPGVVNVAVAKREKDELPPNRAAFAASTAVASNGVAFVTSPLNLSTIKGTVKCTGAPAPCPVK